MAEIGANMLAETANGLMRAGQWDTALSLLEAAVGSSPAERAVLALAAADAAVNRDFWRGTDNAGPFLARAADAASAVSPGPPGQDAGAGSPDIVWDLELLRLRRDYYTELMGSSGPSFGPSGRSAATLDEFAARAGTLRSSAPDQARAAGATFLAGVIADNLRGLPGEARSLFAAALADAESAGDDETLSEALRHLGYHEAQSGDTALARRRWERCVELRQRAGAVPYVLSQLLLIAGLEDGPSADTAGTARLVGPWASALGIGLLADEAATLSGNNATAR